MIRSSPSETAENRLQCACCAYGFVCVFFLRLVPDRLTLLSRWAKYNFKYTYWNQQSFKDKTTPHLENISKSNGATQSAYCWRPCDHVHRSHWVWIHHQQRSNHIIPEPYHLLIRSVLFLRIHQTGPSHKCKALINIWCLKLIINSQNAVYAEMKSNIKCFIVFSISCYKKFCLIVTVFYTRFEFQFRFEYMMFTIQIRTRTLHFPFFHLCELCLNVYT